MSSLTRRSFVSSIAAAPLMRSAAGGRPNIVYILADDLGWGDLGCYNASSAVPTPNMDRLAGQGVRFTDMHSPSAVCTPTRYGIMTGRYCWRSSLKKGVLWGYSPNLIEPGRLTVPSMLKRAGYQTAGIGKWHLGLGDKEKTDYSKPFSPSPIDHGFDSYFGIPASLDMDPYLYIQNDRAIELPTGGFRGRSKAGDYGDFVTQVDDTVGQVMRALEEKGLASNTLLIMTSDNGADWKLEDKARYAHLANSTWRGEKADAWDGGHRIPFIASWPGQIRPGTVSGQLGCLTDLMATTAAITGQTLPAGAGEDSYNLLPALLGRAQAPIRDAIVHHSVEGVFAIRQGNWKLILGLGSGGFSPPVRVEQAVGGPAGQLYDLAADPAENHNLYQKRPDVVARLSALLDKYQSRGHSRQV